jgi:5-methylcytosine-specific restriction endonuclease McrA
MPFVKPCQHPGCRSWAALRSPYCEEHQPKRDETRHGDSKVAQSIRNRVQWRKVRQIHRQRHPLCFDPFKRHDGPTPMHHVHHILPLATHPHLAHEPTNLASLCIECHNEVETLEGRGQPTQYLFR